ncbi:MAG: hypothetical protein ACD_8C00098G0008 [uncultured bacterium]|nr:MAG: hypothetical protein ACD_8C00098G0008 [uncultured bacterium]
MNCQKNSKKIKEKMVAISLNSFVCEVFSHTVQYIAQLTNIKYNILID